jgi:hypothetical protein
VLVAGAERGGRAAIAEWDLASLKLVKRAALPLSPRTFNMVRAGDRIHVLSIDEQSEIHYLTLTRGLDVEKSIVLEKGAGAVIASDGNIVAVQWCDGAGVLGIDVLDAAGELRGRFSGQPTARYCIPFLGKRRDFGDGPTMPLAVMAGRIYSLSQRFDPSDDVNLDTYLTRLDASAHVQTEVDLAAEAILWGVRGHLLLEAYEPRGRTCRFEERDPIDLQSIRSRNFALDPLGPGVCPHPDEVGTVAGGDGRFLSSPVESGAQSHPSRGEDTPYVEARLFYREGVPYLLEFDRRTQSTWLTWNDGRPARAHQDPLAIDGNDVPFVSAHALGLPMMDARPDAVAGQPPGDSTPRGTVFVLGREKDAQRPTLSEWDLSGRTSLRNVTLPIIAKSYRLVSTGAKLYVVATDGSDRIHCIRLTLALRIEADETVGSGQVDGAAADDQIVAIAWSKPNDILISEKTRVRIYDAAGVPSGTLALPGEVVSMVTVGRGVYALTDSYPQRKDPREPLPEAYDQLFHLDSSGQVRQAIRFPRFDARRLYTSGDRLILLDDTTSEAQVRRADDLEVLGDLGFVYSEPGPTWDLAGSRFDLVAGPHGRFVSTEGDVLDANFSHIDSRFAVGPLAARALWIGGEPAILDWRSPEAPPRIRWTDP